jgi:hypothetical protein
MSKAINGYLIDYGRKKGFMEPIEPQKHALVTREQLAQMLTNKPSYTVWNANFVILDDYRTNHDKNDYEDFTEKKLP